MFPDSKSISRKPPGLALPTACAKAIDACAIASASEHGGASGYAKAMQVGNDDREPVAKGRWKFVIRCSTFDI